MKNKVQRMLISGDDLSKLDDLIPDPIELLLVTDQEVDADLTVRIYSVQKTDGTLLILVKCSDGSFARVKTGVFTGSNLTVEHLRKVWQGLKVAELSFCI